MEGWWSKIPPLPRWTINATDRIIQQKGPFCGEVVELLDRVQIKKNQGLYHSVFKQCVWRWKALFIILFPLCLVFFFSCAKLVCVCGGNIWKRLQIIWKGEKKKRFFFFFRPWHNSIFSFLSFAGASAIFFVSNAATLTPLCQMLLHLSFRKQ